MSGDERALLVAEGASRTYGSLQAVDGVDLVIADGASVGIAGESGSGKSTLLRLLLRLERPSAGRIHFEGVDLWQADRDCLHRFRRSVQAVFQDPGSSFNPRMRMWRSVTEPAWVAGVRDRQAQRTLAADLLASVGLSAQHLEKYPHQLSGGERQRAALARALSTGPRLVILDEPVTSLDVSIRGSVLNLLAERARGSGATYVVVSHDLSAIYHLTDVLYIMYRGLVVEHGSTTAVIHAPQHPYTQMLVASVGDPLYAPEADDSDTPAPPGACPYIRRCPYAFDRCVDLPPLYDLADGRSVRCHLHDPASATTSAAQPVPVEVKAADAGNRPPDPASTGASSGGDHAG